MKYVKLSNIASIQMGKTPKRSELRYWGDGFPWLSISDMKSEVINATKEQITEEAIIECGCKLIKKGTLLMSFKLSVGKLAFAGTDLYTNEAICGLIPKNPENIDLKYFYYALKNTKMTGSNIAAKGLTLNSVSLGNLQIPFYENLDDQIRIAEVLTRAENLIKQRKESIDLLDEFLKSTFLKMFIYNFDSKDWLFTEVKNTVEKQKNAIKAGPFWFISQKEFYVEKGYKIYGQEQVINDDLNFGNYYINEELYRKLESCKIKEGDVLISLVDTYGKISVIPKNYEKGIINPRLMKISFDKSIINPIYFKNLFKSDYLLKQLSKLSRGGTMDIINSGIVKEIKIPVPPIKLQNQFTLIVEKVESLKKEYEASLSELENLYGVLSQKAFKGELDLSKVNAEIANEEIKTPIAGSLEPLKEDVKVSPVSKKEIEKFKYVSKTKRDITNLSLADYYGIPLDIQVRRENIDFDFIDDDLFYQFLLKDHFKNESFTSLDLYEKLHNLFYHNGNMDFDHVKWKNIIFQFLDSTPPLLEQIYDEIDNTVKLKLTDEAYKA